MVLALHRLARAFRPMRVFGVRVDGVVVVIVAVVMPVAMIVVVMPVIMALGL